MLARLLAVAAGLGAALVAAPLRAGSFHPDGSFAFDPTAIDTFDFEDGLPPPVEGEEPLVRAKSAAALSGAHVITIQPFGQATMAVKLPAGARTLRVSLWARAGEAIGFFIASHDEHHRAPEITSLYPTGRITSDGWMELANENVPIDGTRAEAVVGVFSPTGCEIDAVEILVDGTPSAPLYQPCDGVAGGGCAEGQLCYWSECRDVSGWVPPIPADRDEVSAYLANRLRFLFGPFTNRTLDLPAAEEALARMGKAKTKWGYWNAFMLAVRRLHDGHTGTSGLATFALDNPKPINVCFLEGQADLSQGVAPSDPIYHDVIVSHVGGDHHLGLGPGDRLVRVDGQHPIAWARALTEENWAQPAVSNHETHAEHASALRGLIARFANEIEIVDCDPSSQICGPVTTISIRDIPFDEPDTPVDYVACDNRPLRHVPGAPASHQGGFSDVYSGLVLECSPEENIHGVEWESLYTTNGSDGIGGPLKSALLAINAAGAKGAILDHRKGTGGTFAGPDIVWDWAMAPRAISFYQARQHIEDEQPTLAQGAAIFQQGLSSGGVIFGGTNGHTTIPVALLITEDVSASDWLPLGLKGAPNLRIFGPYQTNGGFSTRFQLGYWLGMTIVLASGDTYLVDGRTINGHGVEPDEVVLPKQSDLLNGVDTVFEAALAWVRDEVTP
jgi:hypothetical protein